MVVVLDFDKTILDCDSDDWVVENLGLVDLFKELLPLLPYNTLIDKMMEELWSRGKTVEDIAACLKEAPLNPNFILAIRCDLKIMSDANVFFIETILKHNGIRNCFSEINTNPGFVNIQGRLQVSPFHDFISSPHGCSLCPPNLCKGMIIDRIQASFHDQGKRMIYVGDGKNDFCPSLKLTDRDDFMPRKNFPVWDLVHANPELIKASVQEWSDGEDLERVPMDLINTIFIDQERVTRGQLVGADCKQQTSSVSSVPEPIRSVLRVYR